MKKQLLILTLFVSIAAVKLFSQEKNEMTTLPTVTVTSETLVNKEIDRAFKKAFPNAQLLDWYEVNKMYLVKFIEDDMKHHALFTKKGMLKYDISFGDEKNLSKDLLGKLQNAYDEYNITAVSNVKEDGRNIWVINLENSKHLVLARIENDELEETFKYNKN
jgi:hypothetical protein